MQCLGRMVQPLLGRFSEAMEVCTGNHMGITQWMHSAQWVTRVAAALRLDPALRSRLWPPKDPAAPAAQGKQATVRYSE